VLSDRPKLLPRTHRGLRRRPLPGIASPSPEQPLAAAATAGHRRAPSPEPRPRRPTPPIDSRWEPRGSRAAWWPGPAGPRHRRAHPAAEGHMCEDWDFPKGLSAREGHICEALKISRDLCGKVELQ
jgi:hypothetical protein